MKTKSLIVAIILLVSSTAVYSQDTPFKDWLKDASIGATYITKMMLDMAPDMKIGNRSISDLEDMLEQVEIYTNAKNPNYFTAGSYMEIKANDIMRANKYDLVMQLQEDGRNNAFYAKKSKEDEDIITDLVMITIVPDSKLQGRCTVIRLVGEFDLDDIRDITRSTAKKSKNTNSE